MEGAYVYLEAVLEKDVAKDWIKGKYFIKGASGNLWTDSIDEAVDYFKKSLERFEQEVYLGV